MSTPFLFSGVTILFWGWQTGLLIPAVAMALVLEASHFVKSKWDLSLDDFNRVSDICTILLAGLIIFVVATNPITSIMIILKWLPVICFPLLAAQEYSTSGKIDIRSLMLIARKKAVGVEKQHRTIQLSYPYAVLCIFSAGSANRQDGSFYICLLMLVAWALWPYRSRRFSPIWWIILLAVTGGMGYTGHIGLYRLQTIVMDLGGGFFSNNGDPFRRSTSIGDIGELKLSDQIVFRITPESSRPFKPVLVRESSYNVYLSSTWYATHSQFRDISPEPDRTTWNLQADPSIPGDAFTIWSPLKNGKGMLKLPLGAFQLEELPVLQLKQAPLGAVKVEEGPGLVSYRVRYNTETARDLPPDQTDLKVPSKEMEAISQIIDELQLKSKSPGETAALLYTFFQEKFAYSLTLGKSEKGKTPLATFLLSSRSGHCEYFATATVLMLRACGIPARYASGYSAHEFSKLEQQVVVRKRHAHAWTLVYLDGKWRNLDTTSSSWIGIEDEAASKMHIFQDVWSFLLFKVSQWRWGIDKEDLNKYIFWLLAPLVIILARRMYVRKKIKRIQTGVEDKTTSQTFSQGKNSTFYRIEKRLNELGFERNPWETTSRWVKRIEETSPGLLVQDDILSCLHLHYQDRFGMNGLTPEEESQLKSEVEALLERLRKGKKEAGM